MRTNRTGRVRKPGSGGSVSKDSNRSRNAVAWARSLKRKPDESMLEAGIPGRCKLCQSCVWWRPDNEEPQSLCVNAYTRGSGKNKKSFAPTITRHRLTGEQECNLYRQKGDRAGVEADSVTFDELQTDQHGGLPAL